MENTNITPIQKALEIVGGANYLADHLDLSVQAIYKWVNKNKVPPSRCVPIETLTKKQVTRYELRPDIFGTKK